MLLSSTTALPAVCHSRAHLCALDEFGSSRNYHTNIDMSDFSIPDIAKHLAKPFLRSIFRRDDDGDDEMAPSVLNAYVAYYRHIAYTKQTVYFSSCLIFFALLVHLFSTINNYIALRRGRGRTTADAEAHVTPGMWSGSKGLSLRRVPIAILNLLRIVGCRYNFQVDPFSWNARFTTIEIAIPVAYWIALLTWTFVNCEYTVAFSPPST